MFSSDPFQRLTAGGTFNRTFRIFLARCDLFMIIAALVFVPMAFMMVSIFQFVGTSMHTMLNAMDTESNNLVKSGSLVDDPIDDAMVQQMSTFGSQFLLEYIALMIVSIAGEGAMSFAVAELYAGRDPSWLDCLKKGFSRWCDLFGSAFLVGFALGLGNTFVQLVVNGLALANNGFLSFLAFLISIVWILANSFTMVSLLVLSPVIMVEGKGPINAIKRCWVLSWNNRCYIFCTIFCLCFAFYMSQLILTLILLSTGGQDAVFSTGGALLVVLPFALYLPLNVIAKTVVYINIRVQQEGMNHSVFTGELYGGSPSLQPSKYALLEQNLVEQGGEGV